MCEWNQTVRNYLAIDLDSEVRLCSAESADCKSNVAYWFIEIDNVAGIRGSGCDAW